MEQGASQTHRQATSLLLDKASGIHTHKPHLKSYYEADGFHVLGPGAPLDLQLPIGRLRYPAEPSMRHLVRPLAGHVTYGHGVLAGLLARQ
ncbi:hypothetical protein SUDANB176_07845 (plasmid) [Streptomyces sp. enrichment culture]|uniref:hypothetical protein n=1 Tax=Streptomyces sp. enrichment culture TaxID=1795815 RepID=UPI003F5476B0